MPYQTGKGILYLISQKIEIKFPLQHEFFSSAKSRLSFLFGIFFVFLDMMHVTLSVIIMWDMHLHHVTILGRAGHIQSCKKKDIKFIR